MLNILGLKFREHGQIYYFEKADFEVEIGDKVIVKTDQGQGLGTVVSIRDDIPEDAEPEEEVKPVHRPAGEEDLVRQEENDQLGKEAFAYCTKCVREHKLDMKLVDVEVFFDRSKIVFYFTAPNRIDFRELVKDLVKNYRTRIELRQIGVRHETQMIGAVGNCGMVCCCRRFLRKFAPVTIKMAKEQNLFLNPAKISGICGRLLCCLSYEQQNYEQFHKACPKLGKKYQTDNGSVKVLRANMFRNTISVLSDSNEELEVTLEEWSELNPSRPDQAKQDAARAAAKKAAEEARKAEAEEAARKDAEKAEAEKQEAEEDRSSSEAASSEAVLADTASEVRQNEGGQEQSGRNVSEDSAAISSAQPDASKVDEIAPADLPDADKGAAAPPVSTAGEPSNITTPETVAEASPESVGLSGTSVNEDNQVRPADGAAQSQKESENVAEASKATAADTADADSAAGDEEEKKKRAEERARKGYPGKVKSADPSSKRLSRGRRKRKRRPRSSEGDNE